MSKSAKPPSLSRLAQRINAEHRACKHALQQGLLHALRAGELLVQAKATVEHGQWIPWLDKHCDCNQRLAQKYMQVARHFPELEQANAARVADLSFREALRLIGANAATVGHFRPEHRPKLLDLAEQKHKSRVATVADGFRRTVNSVGDGNPVVVSVKRPPAVEPSPELIARLARREPFKSLWKQIRELDREVENLLDNLERTIANETAREKMITFTRNGLWYKLLDALKQRPELKAQLARRTANEQNGQPTKGAFQPLSLPDAIDKLNEVVSAVRDHWPDEYVETMGHHLVSLGQRILHGEEIEHKRLLDRICAEMDAAIRGAAK